MLRGLVGFESPEQRLFASRLFGLPQPPVAEHQIVVRLNVLWIHRQHLLQRRDGFLVAPVEEQDPPDLVQHDAIARILLAHFCQALQRTVVIAIGPLNHRQEEMRARQPRAQLQRLVDEGTRRAGLAFLDQCARHVHPSVRIRGFDLGNAPEGILGALEVAL